MRKAYVFRDKSTGDRIIVSMSSIERFHRAEFLQELEFTGKAMFLKAIDFFWKSAQRRHACLPVNPATIRKI